MMNKKLILSFVLGLLLAGPTYSFASSSFRTLALDGFLIKGGKAFELSQHSELVPEWFKVKLAELQQELETRQEAEALEACRQLLRGK